MRICCLASIHAFLFSCFFSFFDSSINIFIQSVGHSVIDLFAEFPVHWFIGFLNQWFIRWFTFSQLCILISSFSDAFIDALTSAVIFYSCIQSVVQPCSAMFIQPVRKQLSSFSHIQPYSANCAVIPVIPVIPSWFFHVLSCHWHFRNWMLICLDLTVDSLDSLGFLVIPWDSCA